MEIIRWYLWLGIYIGICSAREQKFAIEPQDQTAVVGSTVTLPCRVINKSGFLQWTKDDFALGSHRNLSEYGRYAMIGSDEEGDYSLAIEGVSLDDNARFQCQVGPGKHGEPGIRSRFASLTVLVPPEKPEILQGSELTTTEDREIELECVSRNGKPGAEIIWIDGSNNVVTNHAESKFEELPNRLVISRSILRITPKKEHHNTTFACQAQNTAERTPQSAKIKLHVKYAPKVTVRINSGTEPGNSMWNQLIEGMDVKISCSAEANPPDVSYRWYLNDEKIFNEPPESPTEITIRNISRQHHESIVKCEAYNSVGKSEDSETLHVIYGPRFVTKPQSVQAERNTAVTLTCEVNGNPPSEISWIHEKVNKIVGKSSNLTVKVSEETSGKYKCKALTNGFPEISVEASIHMKGRPIIKRQPVQLGIPGDSVRLECNAYSIPAANRITWSFNGREIISDGQDYSVSEQNEEYEVRSSLVIQDSRTDHYGIYNCTVTNDYGSDTVEIMLKPQKSFPLLIVMIGVVGSVMVIVTVILITILCQRKVKKMPPPPPAIVIDSEKHCKDSDRSSNISDIKLEIRTGSSASNQNCDDYSGGHDSDSVITRIGMPLSNSLNLDRYSINRFSTVDYPDPVFPPKSDGHNNNGYVPFADYSKDYNPPPSSHNTSPSISSASFHTNSLDMRFNSTYGNPFLRTSNSPTVPTLPNGQPPPPPYCTLRNGALPQLGNRFNPSPTSQYIMANNVQQAIISKKGSLATHV
ncbi:irregular chiasm C-roughest protein-like isoform X2 [Planococcus citri]|uniref:irregular chiasm C-roughest protein-like isoform X2 n=1 Tax=Planococcus citri TaxID=170843 RepID=UPI0031F8CCCB